MGRKFIDMTGWVMKEHGVPESRLTVLHRIEDYVDAHGVHYIRWECQCECGKLLQAVGKHIRDGSIKSCGCLLKESSHNRTFIDLTGKKFGQLTVLYRAADYIEPTGRARTMWHCGCECGNEKDIRGTHLTSGATTSCGCMTEKSTRSIDKSIRQYDDNGNLVGRICACCKRMLPIDEYYKGGKSSDGVPSTCKYCQAHSLQGRYYRYKRSATIRKLDFELTKEEFNAITERPCYYCGEYSNNYFGTKYSGVDRVDSSVGYILSNVVPCCTICNRMKLDHTLQDWFAKMEQILNYIKQQGDLREHDKQD